MKSDICTEYIDIKTELFLLFLEDSEESVFFKVKYTKSYNK